MITSCGSPTSDEATGAGASGAGAGIAGADGADAGIDGAGAGIDGAGAGASGVGAGIDAPVSSLRGAGPVTAARLGACGIASARDLLLRLPRGYDDLRRVTPLGAVGAAPDGEVVLVRGTVSRPSGSENSA